MKKEIFLLILILAGAFLVRLYRFDGPVADWHSWRQSDTSAVSRNFVKYGFDVLHPRFDDLSNGVSLIDNPKGYRFVEFPIYNIAQAFLFKSFGKFTIEQWGRLVTIFSSLVSIVFVFLLLRKYICGRAGLIGALFYAFVPYNIYYGRVLLPDSLMVAASLGSLYFFSLWLDKKSNIYYSLSILFFATSLVIKPFVLFYTLPFLYLAYRRFGLKFFTKWQLWVFFIVSFIPLGFWRIWMSQYPEGIPRSDWLFNGNGIRWKGAFFHWIFAERISHLILGFFGLPFVIVGILARVKKEGFLFHFFLISSLIFLTDMATGNVQHDYYQISIIPTLTFLFARGAEFILANSKNLFNRYISYVTIVVSILFMLAFGWFKIRDYYSIQHPEIIEAGHAVDLLTPKDSKVIAIYNGDTTFLYHTNRQGWPVFERDLSDFVKAGATHIAFVNPGKDELNFATQFTTVERTNNYAIFDLTKPLPAGIEHLKKQIQEKEFLKRQDLLRKKGLLK